MIQAIERALADESKRDLSMSPPDGVTVSVSSPRADAARGLLPRQSAPLSTRELCISYGGMPAVIDVSIDIEPRSITAVIGPSGCGKSSFLRAFNRMNDFMEDCRTTGKVFYRGMDLYNPAIDAADVRRRIGMVFQKPNPFPGSIRKNVAWGPKINGYRGNLDQLVEDSLRKAALWEEVKDKLDKSGFALSGGQQQRLCIARAIAMQPEVILMDEPCSALDPASSARIEELIRELSCQYTIVIVTHNMQQAARVSDVTAFFLSGRLVEVGPSSRVFSRPEDPRTESYINGRFG